MKAGHVILGDWGTTALRLYLVDAKGLLIDSLGGPGVSKVKGNCESLFLELCAPWLKRYSIKRALLSGMVGSTLGWRLADYIVAPVDLHGLADQLLSIETNGINIQIVPGVRALNPFNYHDVMRGEEVQVLGAMALSPALVRGEHWLCLPGTHSKWVRLVNGRLETFFTLPVGELFDVLRHHSTLLMASDVDNFFSEQFDSGVALARSGDCLAQLFQLRSRAVLKEIDQVQQQQLLSGLLIGSDIAIATQKMASAFSGKNPLTIIASYPLSKYYQRVADMFEIQTQCIDGDVVSLAGLQAIEKQAGQAQ
jgi:2-dehydro-3-deoxygalactonokinase